MRGKSAAVLFGLALARHALRLRGEGRHHHRPFFADHDGGLRRGLLFLADFLGARRLCHAERAISASRAFSPCIIRKNTTIRRCRIRSSSTAASPFTGHMKRGGWANRPRMDACAFRPPTPPRSTGWCSRKAQASRLSANLRRVRSGPPPAKRAPGGGRSAAMAPGASAKSNDNPLARVFGAIFSR